MEVWIALLRGINVGGHNRIAMADLRALCASLGWRDVSTYIQSGNVVFRADGRREELSEVLEGALRDRSSMSVPVVLRSGPDLERVVGGNPFLQDGMEDTSKLHVGFLAEPPSRDTLTSMPDLPPGREELRVVGGDVFLHYPDGVGRSKLTTTWLDRALGAPVTMRNWRTVTRLAEMAGTL